MQLTPIEHRRDAFTVSTDPARLDLDAIHDFLTHDSYWVPGIAREAVEASVRHSLCFGLYDGSAQIGFARIVTDYVRFGYLADVYVLERYRGRSLGTWLMECIMAHPVVCRLARLMLATADAHGLYAKFGFAALAEPERFMENVVRTPALLSEDHA